MEGGFSRPQDAAEGWAAGFCKLCPLALLAEDSTPQAECWTIWCGHAFGEPALGCLPTHTLSADGDERSSPLPGSLCASASQLPRFIAVNVTQR